MVPTALSDLPTSTWTNWVGSQSFTPAFVGAPGDEEEVAALVRQAAERGVGVRVAGAGHSFTPVVETDGVLLDLSALRGVLHRRVTDHGIRLAWHFAPTSNDPAPSIVLRFGNNRNSSVARGQFRTFATRTCILR